MSVSLILVLNRSPRRGREGPVLRNFASPMVAGTIDTQPRGQLGTAIACRGRTRRLAMERAIFDWDVDDLPACPGS
jgi:hypothetical protein